jgi:hypothetical protein
MTWSREKTFIVPMNEPTRPKVMINRRNPWPKSLQSCLPESKRRGWASLGSRGRAEYKLPFKYVDWLWSREGSRSCVESCWRVNEEHGCEVNLTIFRMVAR